MRKDSPRLSRSALLLAALLLLRSPGLGVCFFPLRRSCKRGARSPRAHTLSACLASQRGFWARAAPFDDWLMASHARRAAAGAVPSAPGCNGRLRRGSGVAAAQHCLLDSGRARCAGTVRGLREERQGAHQSSEMQQDSCSPSAERAARRMSGAAPSEALPQGQGWCARQVQQAGSARRRPTPACRAQRPLPVPHRAVPCAPLQRAQQEAAPSTQQQHHSALPAMPPLSAKLRLASAPPLPLNPLHAPGWPRTLLSSAPLSAIALVPRLPS